MPKQCPNGFEKMFRMKCFGILKTGKRERNWKYKNVDNVWLNLTIAITGTIIVMGTRIFVARTYNL